MYEVDGETSREMSIPDNKSLVRRLSIRRLMDESRLTAAGRRIVESWDVMTLDDVRLSDKLYDYSYVKRVFERTHMKIMNPLCFVTEDEETLYMMNKPNTRCAYQNLYCKTIIITDFERIEKRVPFIGMWMKDPRIRVYDRIDFIPSPHECPSDVYNIWRIDKRLTGLKARGKKLLNDLKKRRVEYEREST